MPKKLHQITSTSHVLPIGRNFLT